MKEGIARRRKEGYNKPQITEKERIKMTTHQQRRVERVEHLAQGKGHVWIERLLGEREMNGKCRMYAKVPLEPGCSIGYHEHHQESETYYILSGRGRYQDDDRFEEVAAGAVTFTGDGHGHGLENTGEEDLVFMALILLGDRG